MQLQIESVKKYQPINKTYFLMGHGVSLMHSRFKVEIQATKLLQVAESSCAVQKNLKKKKTTWSILPTAAARSQNLAQQIQGFC